MSTLVVTGTGTGVGKTVVTAAIAAVLSARGRSVAVVKPAQTGVEDGAPGDMDEVSRLSGVRSVHELQRYRLPLAPAAAARLSGSEAVDLSAAAQVTRRLTGEHDSVLVEGAGGLLVRFDDDGRTIADLAHELDAEVLVVTQPDLGTLNHTALTLEAMAHRGLRLAGVVIGAWPADPDLACRSNIRDLQTLAARPLAGALAAGAATAASPPIFLQIASAGLAPALGGSFDAADFESTYPPLED
jgi:dethiobiotin synthetase